MEIYVTTKPVILTSRKLVQTNYKSFVSLIYFVNT